MITRRASSAVSSCFRPTTPCRRRSPSPPPPSAATAAGNPNLTTSFYHTHLGFFTLTWSRTPLFSRSLHLHLHPHPLPTDDRSISSSTPSSFHLNLKPFLFWNKSGSKPLSSSSHHHHKLTIFWDLTRAKFGSGPEPESGFYIAVVRDSEMALIVGDSEKAAYQRTKAKSPAGKTRSRRRKSHQELVVRMEHAFGRRFYSTRARFGGETREISIECDPSSEDPRLVVGFDGERLVEVKHLRWKFRGNERVEVGGGQMVLVSWDVYNWLFEDENDDGCALFTFRFEKNGLFGEGEEEEGEEGSGGGGFGQRMRVWSSDPCGLMSFERKKLRTMRSSSSSSLSSASSSGCGSVMEWESVEENQLKDGSTGFSLLVYAWKS